jgi:coenzyme F420 hydrogenase subunit beta
MKSIRDVVKHRLCLGCGACRYDDNFQGMRFNEKKGQYLPRFDKFGGKENEMEFAVCPGKGYPIIRWATELYGGGASYNLDLGYVHRAYAVHSNSEVVLKNASSGGIITELSLYLLSRKIVDKVAVTKFVYTREGVRTKTILTESSDDILESQGSKYCPVCISDALKEIEAFDGKVAYIGTPCQVAGIRALQQGVSNFSGKRIITVSNFCGGYKNYRNIRQLANIHGIDFKNINYFRFRGGGQPGSLMMSDVAGNKIQIPYPKYVGYTGYSRLLRCRLCVDATAELADFACGDAWLPRFQTTSSPWSIVITRNSFASGQIDQMIEAKTITTAPVTLEETIESQKLNIRSTKYRQTSRMRLHKMLGYRVPSFDGGYRKERTSLRTELIVYLKHGLTLFLEKIGIYYKIYFYVKLKYK